MKSVVLVLVVFKRRLNSGSDSWILTAVLTCRTVGTKAWTQVLSACCNPIGPEYFLNFVKT